MKKLILLIALLLPLSVSAQEHCARNAELAFKIMTIRQNGYPLADILSKVSGSVRVIVIESYKRKLEKTGTAKEYAAASYRDEIYMLCVGGE